MTQAIYLNADRKQTTPVVHMVQGDTGRELECHITDRVLTGTDSAAIWCERPDGSVWSAVGTISNNAATFAFPAGGPLNKAGQVKTQVKITDTNSLVVSTFDLIIEVHENVSGISTPADETWRDSLAASLQADIDSKVPQTTKVNGKALSGDITVNAEDVPYDNTASGLTATDTQAAVDEVGAFVTNFGKEVTNGSLISGHNYLVQFQVTDGTARRLQVAWKATTATVRLFGANVNTSGRMRFYVIAVKYSSGSLVIDNLWRADISSAGAASAPTQDDTAVNVEHIWDLG